MKWFKHDSNANMDSKLQEILLDYGLEGYGLYFYCLEMIAANVEAHNLTFELEHDSRIIARNTGNSVEKVQQMMSRMVDLKLFENCDGTITCLKMMGRTDEYTQKLLSKNSASKNKQLDMCPDTIGTKSEKVRSIRIEENRIEENRLRLTALANQIAEAWNLMAEDVGFSKIISMSAKRKTHLKARIKADGVRAELEWWKKLFEFCSTQQGLMDQPWFGLDWFLKSEDNLLKMMEGKYAKRFG